MFLSISNNPLLQRGMAWRIMAERLWRLAKRSIRRPNCLRRKRVFGRREMSHSATVEDIEQRHAPLQLLPYRAQDCHASRGDVRNDKHFITVPGCPPSRAWREEAEMSPVTSPQMLLRNDAKRQFGGSWM